MAEYEPLLPSLVEPEKGVSTVTTSSGWRGKLQKGIVGDIILMVAMPSLLFLVAAVIFIFGYHEIRMLSSLIIAIMVGFAFFVVMTGIVQRHLLCTTLGVVTFGVLLFAISIGMHSNHEYLEFYWEFQEGAEFRSVDPSTSANATNGASILHFKDGSFADNFRTVGFVFHGSIYCVAPIARQSKFTSDIQYWAAGVNCCSKRSDFQCSSSGDLRAQKTSIVQHTDIYRMAVQEAKQLYNLTSPVEGGRFVSLSGDSDMEAWDAAMDLWFWATLVLLVALVLIALLAIEAIPQCLRWRIRASQWDGSGSAAI